ncbi:hypothetical protein VTI74DRAFT_8820 [Chaetomium olivicolor]
MAPTPTLPLGLARLIARQQATTTVLINSGSSSGSGSKRRPPRRDHSWHIVMGTDCSALARSRAVGSTPTTRAGTTTPRRRRRLASPHGQGRVLRLTAEAAGGIAGIIRTIDTVGIMADGGRRRQGRSCSRRRSERFCVWVWIVSPSFWGIVGENTPVQLTCGFNP